MSDATVTTSSATKAAPISADPAVMISRVLWLVHLRWAMVACFAAAGALLWFATGWREVAYWLWPLAALVAAYNLAVWLALHWLAARPSGGARALAIRRLTNAQIAADLIALTATMYLTGGAVNPLIAVMVFYLAVAASLLPVRDAYFQAVLAGLLYAGLTIGEPILEAAMGQPVTFRTWPMEIRVLRVLLVVAIMFFMVYFTNAILARLRRINRRLLAANRELAVLDLTKSRFLRISSHQLRSPIAAIHSLLAAIQEVGALSPKQFDLMQKIHNRSAEIMKQLDEMMLLSTVREKAIETQQRRPVDLGKVLAEVAGQFKAETDRREVALEMLAEGRLSVEAWEDALETVFVHLLGNAVKYTQPGGSVTVTARPAGGKVEVEVADTGIGIPTDQQQRVFDEFFRATNARQVSGGTGMGLSIVKEIVEGLGGRINLTSAEGKGTKVRVTFPPAPRTAGRDETTDRPRRLAGSET